MVLGSAIRHLAVSHNRNIFLAALFKNTVYTWSTDTGHKIAEFDTVLDYGGNRLALSNSKDIFIAGAYTRYGIACYRLTDGRKIWHRKDLKGVQEIQISPDDEFVFCGFSDKPGYLLSLNDGTTVDRIRSVREYFFDPYQGWCVQGGLPDRNPEHYELPYQSVIFDSDGRKHASIPNSHLFDCAFSLDYVAICSGTVHIISRYIPDNYINFNPNEGHFLHVTYCPKVDAFFGIIYNGEKRVPSILVRLDLISGQIRTITLIERSDYAFCNGGEYLITSHGSYVNTITGEVEKMFDFPQKEYQSY